MATERLILDIRTTGTRQVSRDLGRLSKEASSANRTLALLRSTLVVVAGARVIGQFAALSDTLTNIRNRIRLVTTSTDQLNAVQQRLFNISQETRSAFETNAIIFNRLARSADGMGLTFNELIDITRGLAQAVAIAGATSQEARNALIQFSQGLASGTLRGDELRSVAEQLPPLADAIAKEFTNAGLTTASSLGLTEEALQAARKEVGDFGGGALVAFAKANEGVLTNTKVIRALQKALQGFGKDFENIDVTVGQAFTTFNNELILFVGNLTNSIELGRRLQVVLQAVARNFGLIASAIGLFVGILVFNIITSQLLRLGTTAVSTFKFLSEGFLSLGKIVTSTIRIIAVSAARVGAVILANFLPALVIIGTLTAGFLVLREVFKDVDFGNFSRDFGAGIGAVIGFIRGLIDAFGLLPGAIGEIAINAANRIREIFGGAINFIISGLQSIGVDADFIEIEPIENRFEGAGSRIKDIMVENIREGVMEGAAAGGDIVGTLETTFENTFNFVRNLFSKGLIAREEFDRILDSLNEVSGGARKGSRAALDAFAELAKGVDPVAKAFDELVDAIRTVNEAIEAGLDADVARRVLNQVALGALGLRDAEFELQRRIELVNFALENQAISADQARLALLKATSDIREEFENLAGSVFPAIRAQRELNNIQIALLEHQRDLNRENIDAAEFQTRLARAAFGLGQTEAQVNEEIEALTKNQELLRLSTAELEAETRRLQIAFLDTQRDAASGANRAFLRLIDDATNAAKFTEEAFTNAFKNIEDQILQFVETGTFSFNEFFRNIAAQLIRLGTQQALAGFGGFFTNAFGGTGGFGFGGPSGSTLGGIGGLITSLLPFQQGGSFTVGANTAVQSLPGIDNRLIAFRARDGEEVSVTPRNRDRGAGGPINQVFNIQTKDADSFVRSQTQIQNRALAGLDNARRRR